MKKSLSIIFMLAFCLQSAFGVGALFGRRAFSADTTRPLWLKNYDATVTVHDQIAITHVDQTFQNEDNFRKEGVFIFPLPENAIVTELALWINGQRVIGEVMEADTARMKYDSIVRRRIDPALLEDMGDNIFKLSVFPIEPAGQTMSARRIEITYAELLPYDAGTVSYKFFMKTVNLSAKPLARARVSFDLKAQRKILSMASPTHTPGQDISVVRVDEFHYTVVYGEENAHSEKNLALDYELENAGYLINYLTYVPDPVSGMFFDSAGDHSYYLLWITPPDEITASQVLPKKVVFVADISSSMAGTRIEQLRAALNAMIDLLNPGDEFNIIAFATKNVSFRSDLVAADDTTLAAAHGFINALGEGGLTNMEEALMAGLGSAWGTRTINAMIFLTDGVPTWPANSTSEGILAKVDSANTGEIAIHTFGIGSDVEAGFLKQLARGNSGFSMDILANDSISAVMENFMKKISYPLLRNIALDYGGLDKYDLFPRFLPNLYWGSQLTVLGRYRNAGTFEVTFSGSVLDSGFTMKQSLAFPSPASNHPFVPRMWASAKIDFLLDDIAIYGELKELVDEVKRLGKKYAIITPYTSMLVVEPPTRLTEDKTQGTAREMAIFQNTPNPFNPSTLIRFNVPKLVSPQKMQLSIYDVTGNQVRTLAILQIIERLCKRLIRVDILESDSGACSDDIEIID